MKKLEQSRDIVDGLPFEFPVIVDPSLSITQDGSTQELSLDILPINIEGKIS